MLFAYLRTRKLKKIVEQSCATLVRMQFVIAETLPANHAADPWVLGYVYGACTAVLDRMGIDPSPEAYELLESGYATLFGSARLGKRVLAESMELRTNETFAEAQAIGGKEILRASSSRPIPFALGAHLGKNKSP